MLGHIIQEEKNFLGEEILCMIVTCTIIFNQEFNQEWESNFSSL